MTTDDSHLKRVTEEFTRQADTFDAYAGQADVKVEERFRKAIGGAGTGDILDVACGPGVVTAALAGNANAITAFDATPAMLEKAKQRCAKAGLTNVNFEQGNAESMSFADSSFDGVVTRLAIHHFVTPATVLGEISRVLRTGGTLAVADVVVSENAEEAALQNAIEIVRDPSHVRMLPESELTAMIAGAGLEIISNEAWEKKREFNEWMGIANDPTRNEPLRTIALNLADAGKTAGMGLSIDGGDLVFFHRWHMITARKPAA